LTYHQKSKTMYRIRGPKRHEPYLFFLRCAYFFKLSRWQAGVLEITLACFLFVKEALGPEILTAKVVIGFSKPYSQFSLPV
jgi:hypothetical protein